MEQGKISETRETYDRDEEYKKILESKRETK